jgi:hypothetical protein
MKMDLWLTRIMTTSVRNRMLQNVVTAALIISFAGFLASARAQETRHGKISGTA